MENKIHKIISDCKPELSPMSVKTYSNCNNMVLEFLKSNNIDDLYIKYNEVIDILKQKYEKAHTIKTKLASIIVLLKCIKTTKNKKAITKAINRYTEIIDELNNNIKNNLSTHEKTEEQKKNWINNEDIENLDKILLEMVPSNIKTNRDLKNFRNYIIFKIYQDIPSRNELADSKIIFYKNDKQLKGLNDEYNYIVLDRKAPKSAYYLMNQYKTSKNYGQKKIKFNDSLYDLLEKYKKAIDTFTDQNTAFLNDDATEQLSRNRLGVIYSNLGKHIDKKLGTTKNRHIAISNLVNIDKMEKLADKMGNSITEQIQTYAKK
jgi:hypothetical protein